MRGGFSIVFSCAGLALMTVIIGSSVHPFGVVKGPPGAPLLNGVPMPRETRKLMEQACANCHSDRVAWPWYSYVAPTSWLVERDVSNARAHMNLSRWNDYRPDQQMTLLSTIAGVIRSGIMPPRQYLLLHPEGRLSEPQREQIYQWTRTERRRVRTQQRAAEQYSLKHD